MNEPTYAAMGGAPKGYDAASYGRDVAAFRTFLRMTAPDTLFLGPGSVGEGPFAMPMGGGVLKSEDLPHATSPLFDVFSYHLYAVLRNGAQAWAHRHKQRRQRHFLKTGSRARRRLPHFTPTFETGSSQANHFGLRKLPMQPAVETPGRPLFFTPSDILFNMQASPSVA